jgi:polysaccharide chain length determinant protein (PEP-CTERM system associated)
VFGGSDSATVAGTAGAGATVGDNDLAARIRETQARLDELKLRFTDKHPDVIALRSALTELKARQQAEIDAVKRGDAGAAARMGLGSNPVFRSIQLQLNQTDVDIAALKGKVAESQGKIASLNKLVNTAPEVEAEFARLNRDYDVTRTEYQALVQRLQQSRLSAQAEETGIVRFEVIDPPSAAFKPVWPKRPPLIIAVLLAALAAGGGVAYLLHRMRPVFNSARELNEITGLPVLGVVNMTRLEKQRARARGRALLYAATASLLMPVTAIVLLTQSQATRLLRHWLG